MTTTTLADVLRERGPLPEQELLKGFRQVLDGLALAHRQGTLHRDISPARIVLDGATWKLTDYGVARVGTVRYMSPERCQGKPTDARSDIYSLGAVLFEAATGRVPFDSEMKFQIMEAQVNNPPPSPRAIEPGVSLELEQVILKALSKNTDVRFQSAVDFKRALDGMARRPARPVPPAVQPAAVQPAVVRPAAVQPAAAIQPAAVSVKTAPPQARPGRRRAGPLVYLAPLAVLVAVGVLLLATGALGSPRVPAVTGMSRDEAERALGSRRLKTYVESVDDTLVAGVVVEQIPAAGDRPSSSRVVTLKVSSGVVAVPALAGLTLSQARARLARVALEAARVDSQYSDSQDAGMVVSSGAKAGAKLAPHSRVNVTVSNGRATCPECGARRESGAKFCTKCAYKY